MHLNQLKVKPIEYHTHLDDFIVKNIKTIKEWIYFEYQGRERMVYSSVDVRNAGYKVAPVDTNLFPAGFNNLDAIAIQRAQTEFTHFLNQYYPKVKKILIIPENFTRNNFYFSNLNCIQKILSVNDIEVLIGGPFYDTINEIDNVTLHPVIKKNDTVMLESGWKPDLIVLNNDLTKGILEILENISQPIIPHPTKGWHMRRKHNHFTAYNEIISRFASEFNLDPWMLSTMTQKCGQIDFKNQTGLECIALLVDKMIFNIKQKYNEYGIAQDPNIFVKADNGTFGIGIMSVKSGDELLSINKKKRHSMNVIKEGVQNREVMIQEGVPTIHTINNHVAENIAYMVNGKVVSFIIRANPSKDQFSNLNTSEMYFRANSDFKFGAEALVAELAAIAVLHETSD